MLPPVPSLSSLGSLIMAAELGGNSTELWLRDGKERVTSP